jgi:chromosome condensin MukBEF ATPase and DNA-binding subunit MukB
MRHISLCNNAEPGIKSLDTRKKEEKRREEKKIHKKTKREREKKQLERQDLFCTREARNLYIKVKETKKEFQPRENKCKAKDGSIICDQNEVLTR